METNFSLEISLIHIKLKLLVVDVTGMVSIIFIYLVITFLFFILFINLFINSLF